ncbi:MAG TPA: metallopeptidase [Candidatus Caldiarchaeum subterraneum]|uniref:Metallopeptidase n=1 Tax=Caldiarchaeum subterraneum TaxID=311458 RepID=A0A832ZVM5_CALS0|nr:metallopeptidase [Candidatus Caldarchaeum subterraneum]
MIVYRPAPDLEERVREIVKLAGLNYVDAKRVKCVRSYGSRGRVYARIHSASKAFFTGLGMKPAYVIEFISENFDKLSQAEQEKIILHELLHIPKSFGGGLISHGRINFDKEVKILRKIIKSQSKLCMDSSK